MNAQTIAEHEAGHAVIQWFVGWGKDIEYIQMTQVVGGVTGGTMKIPVPDRKTYCDKRIARRKLLVLLAGAATTDDPASQHNSEACRVLSVLFGICRITWNNGTGLAVVQKQPNDLLQSANDICKEIVRHESVRTAIQQIAQRLLEAVPDANGVCRVESHVVLEVCQQECQELQKHNEWTAWLDGEE